MAVRGRIFMVLAAACAAIASAAAPAHAQSRGWGGGELELFDQQHFGGERRVFSRDEQNLANAGFNDRAISARVTGGAWQVCIDSGYLGRCVTIDRDEPDLNRLGVGYRISSVRRIDGGWGDDGGWGGRPPRGGLSLYEADDLRGARYDLTAAALNLGGTGFNDRARSLFADGPWWVCAEANYNRCQVVEGRVANLASIGMDNRISSARPVEPGEDVGYGGGYRPPYDGGGYGEPPARGRTAAFYPRPSGRGGPLLACERGGYGGACVQRTADDFCRAQGYSRGEYFSVAPARRGAEVIEDLLCVR